MIKIRGKEFSEETIVEALLKHCNFEEEKEPYYIFKARDVVECNGYRRIILETLSGGLASFDIADGQERVRGQANFEMHRYKKIGTLTNFIKEN